MAGRGRPPYEITEEVLKTAENYASRGLNQQQIADALGISINTLCEKKNDFAEFAEAIKRGKARGISFVADKLLDNVKNSNVTAQIFYLKCHAGWKEAQVVEHTGKDGEPMKVENIYSEPAKKTIEKFMLKVFGNKATDEKSSAEE